MKQHHPFTGQREHALVRLICRRAKTASALKRTPGPSSSEKTILVCEINTTLSQELSFK